MCIIGIYFIMYRVSSHLQGHCRDCKYKPLKCPNPGCNELMPAMPAEKLDSHVDVDCPFRMVVCDHCREEIAANQFKVSEEISRVCTWSYDSLCVLIFLPIGPSKVVPQGSNGVWEVSSKDCKRCSKCT